MVVYLWREAGFVMIFYTSGLQNISPEYYEAALIDGASPFTMLRKDHPAAGKAHHRICAYVYDGQLL